MSGSGFEVVAIDPVVLGGSNRFEHSRLMSPYVWQAADGEFSMLIRVVDEDGGSTGSIWYATGDGLAFTASNEPVLEPGPDDLDIGGCEDPTLVPVEDGCLVYYTGVGPDGTAQLLWAVGPNVRSLEKRGVAHASTATDRNTKEAAIERPGGEWLLLFEYSRDGRSRIGRAKAERPNGPWDEQDDPMRARSGRWDCWHLSTGPLMMDEAEGPVMFYNGADDDAAWAIGWVQFDAACGRETERCEEPLIAAPAQGGPAGRRMAFAASAISINEENIWLFYTHDDRSLMRATIRRIA